MITHYACMPLVANVPAGREGWQRTTCPECAAPCWKAEARLEQLRQALPQTELILLCTQCALRKAAGQ